jgi:hypothetical protein
MLLGYVFEGFTYLELMIPYYSKKAIPVAPVVAPVLQKRPAAYQDLEKGIISQSRA